MSTAEMYKGQLLWGNEFLEKFKSQLGSLYHDDDFMELIHDIRRKAPQEENERTIDEIKTIAKSTLFDERATFAYPALQEIVDEVKSKNCAINSALISVYIAMRMKELSVGTQAAEKPKEDSDYDFRLKYPAEYRCDDGHYVRSKNEVMVDNWLYHHNVCHAYEKAIYSKQAIYTYCSDFFLPEYNLFIEIWGMNDSRYEEKKAKKKAVYRENGYDLLDISGDAVKNVDDVLAKALRRAKQ